MISCRFRELLRNEPLCAPILWEKQRFYLQSFFIQSFILSKRGCSEMIKNVEVIKSKLASVSRLLSEVDQLLVRARGNHIKKKNLCGPNVGRRKHEWNSIKKNLKNKSRVIHKITFVSTRRKKGKWKKKKQETYYLKIVQLEKQLGGQNNRQ